MADFASDFPALYDGRANASGGEFTDKKRDFGLMVDPDKAYSAITTAFFIALVISVFVFPELVAVIIIVASVAGLALNWLSNHYSLQNDGWQKEREHWENGDRWW